MENMERQFKKIAERYCSIDAEDITNDMNLRKKNSRTYSINRVVAFF